MSRRDKKRGTKVRYAVVGAGHVAQKSILPGFAGARPNSELVALISSDPEKRLALGRRYGLKHLGDDREFEQVGRRCRADAVYIATPNRAHRNTRSGPPGPDCTSSVRSRWHPPARTVGR
jgi:predicted dehydrogenase